MTPELLSELGRMYRLRHTVQRRIEYALVICLFAVLVDVLTTFSSLNLHPLVIALLLAAAVVGASAWPRALEHEKSQKRIAWLQEHEDRSQRILPNAPDRLEAPIAGLGKALRSERQAPPAL